MFGHKPSYGLVPGRGQAPPGLDGCDPVLAVVGPLARTAADLALALDIVAGPDADEAVGYRLDLPAARQGRLKDFRVLMIDEHPAAALDGEIRAALHALASTLERAGGVVARHSDLLPDLAAAQGVYSTLLFTAISRGGPPQPDAISAHAWLDALDAQLSVRRQWAEVFGAFDVVLAPAFGVVAFAHDDGDFNSRTHTIDGVQTSYGAQVAWPGMATFANLPATAVPIGKTRSGLPIGAQIIGPYLEDRTPLAFAGMVERELSGKV